MESSLDLKEYVMSREKIVKSTSQKAVLLSMFVNVFHYAYRENHGAQGCHSCPACGHPLELCNAQTTHPYMVGPQSRLLYACKLIQGPNGSLL